MSVDIEVHVSEVKSTNIFQVNRIYEDLHEWFMMKNYASNSDSQFPEKFFWEQRSQNQGREFWIWWRLQKGEKGNSFVKRHIDIDFHGVGITEAEAMWKGQKYKVNKGKMEILIKGWIQFDPDDKWEKGILGPWLEIFWKRWHGPQFRKHKRELLGDIATVQEICRQFFNLPARGGRLKSFSAPRGIEENYDEVVYK
jgi:hypothetical protein